MADSLNHGAPPGPYSDDAVGGAHDAKSLEPIAGDFYRDHMGGGAAGTGFGDFTLGTSAGSALGGQAYSFQEPDDVVRGVSLGGTAFPGSSWTSDFPTAGDHYHSAGDMVTRGVSLGAGAFFHGADGLLNNKAWSMDEEFGGPLAGFGFPVPDKPTPKPSSQRFSHDEPHFNEQDVPPSLPDDKHFKLEPSTVKLHADRPWEIMNSLLLFLQDGCAADILKPALGAKHVESGKKKLSIKAMAFHGSQVCTLKIKIYKQDPGVFSVEFGRRSGCCVGFASTFASAAEHLDKKFKGVQGVPQLPAAGMVPPPPPPPDSFGPPASAIGQEGEVAAHLAPLLDMAGATSAPQMQAEGASALASLAEDMQVRPSLCTAAVLETLEKLLNSDEVADEVTILYPTVKVLRLFAESSPKAVSFIRNHQGLLSQKAKKTVSGLVQKELAEIARLCGVN